MDAEELSNLVNSAMAEVEGSSDDSAASSGEAPAAEAAASPTLASKIGLLNDVELHVTIELGRTQMLIEDVLRLSEGSIVELDKLAGDPVDVYVNERLVARGEVLVLNDNFCIRVSEIVANLEEQAHAAAQKQAQVA